jgi:hypothetical protein
MQLRNEVLACLQERLLNRTEGGRVFERDEDYEAWLLGSEAEKGFVGDPVRALSRPIERRSDAVLHPGIEISDQEAVAIRTVLSRVDLGGVRSWLGAGAAGRFLGMTALILPILADSGGY